MQCIENMLKYISVNLVLVTLLLVNVRCSIANKPNILLIVVDDFRPNVKSFGDQDAFTPNIDRLASSGICFNHAYAQQALCAPSRNSMLTSRRPDSLHLYDFYSYWRDFAGNYTTLPQYFKENGYETVSVGKVFHPGISSNHSDDFPLSWSHEPWHPPTQEYMNSPVCHDVSGMHSNLICPVTTEEQPGGSLPDIQTVEFAVNYLKNTNKTNPFLLAVGIHKPHVPLKYPREYLEYHPFENISLPSFPFYPRDLPTVAWNPWTNLRKRHDIENLNLTFPFETFSVDWIKRIRQSYYSAVTYIDDLIGKLMNELQDQNLQSNTIVMLFGDHGWSLGEHGEWAKSSNFDVAVRVPLIVQVPNLTRNLTSTTDKRCLLQSDSFVELTDIFPTLAELSGLSPLPQCPENSTTTQLCTEGLSFVPLMQQLANNEIEIPWKKAAFSQYPRPGEYPTLHPDSEIPKLNEITIMGYSMRTKRYRYTDWVEWDQKGLKPIWDNVVSSELYDHKIDPDENSNLSGRPGLEKLEAVLSQKLRDGWRKALPV